MALTKVKGHIIADDLALGGNPTTSTQSTGNNTTRIATTAFVQTELSALVDSSPSALNTLNELAAAMGDDANFSTTVTNSIATKLPLAGGTLTGVLTVNTNAATDVLVLKRNSSNGDSGIQFANSSGNLTVVRAASSGDFTIDTAGDIVLDADGGDIQLKDAGVATGRLGLENGDLNIASMRQDYNILFKGMDGSSTITALTLDMSEAGQAIFNNNVIMRNGGNIELGGYNSGNDKGLILTPSDASSYWHIYNRAGGELTFGRNITLGSDEKMRLDSAGKLGIGTNNPTEKLHVSDGNALFDFDANSSLILANAGTNASKIYAGAGDELYIGGNNNYALRFLNDGTNNVVFDNGSNVAIGQSSLTGGSVKLDLHNSGNGVGTQIGFYNDHNTGGHFIGQAGNTSGNIIYYNVANTSQEFYNNNQLKMTLSAAGLLTVTGGINSSGGTVSFADGSSSFDSSDSNGYARFTHVNGSAQIALFRSGGGAGGAYLGGDSDGLHFRNGAVSLKASILQGGTFKINLNGTTDTALQIGDTTRDQAVTMSKASGGAVTREIIRFNGPLRIGTTTGSHDTYITGGGTAAVIVGNQGQLYPGSSNSQDLGSSSYPWRDLYIGDLVLTNENRKNDDGSKGNEIDGTTGNWTIQEGEEHLFIINNSNGKKYKFALEEIN